MVLKNISYEILDKTKLTTDILLRFSDTGLNKEKYASISEFLEYFKLNMNSECSLTLDTKYDEYKELLLIRLILSIPDIHKPDDMNLEQIINHLFYKFTNFYEKNNKLIKSK